MAGGLRPAAEAHFVGRRPGATVNLCTRLTLGNLRAAAACLLLVGAACAVPSPGAHDLGVLPPCRPPNATLRSSLAPPALEGLFPLERVLTPLRVIFVREVPHGQPVGVIGSVVWSGHSMRQEQAPLIRFRGQSAKYVSYRIEGALDVDLRALTIMPDSVPRAPGDSTRFLITATVDSSARTMVFALGNPEHSKMLMFVTSLIGGPSGPWLGSEPADLVDPRGYFCAQSP